MVRATAVALTALGTDYERQVEAEEEEQTFLRDQEAESRRRTEQDEINAARYAAIKRGDLDEAARIAAEGAARARAPRPACRSSRRSGRGLLADGPERPVRHEGPRRRAQAAAGHQDVRAVRARRARARDRVHARQHHAARGHPALLDKGVGGDADELDRMRREVRDGEKTELRAPRECAQLTDAGVARDEIMGAQQLIAPERHRGHGEGGRVREGAQLAVMEANDPALRKMHYYKTASGADLFQLTLGPNEAMPPSRKQRLHATGAMDMADGQAPARGRRTRSRRGRSTTRARAAASSPRPGGALADAARRARREGRRRARRKPKRAAPVSSTRRRGRRAAARAAEAPPDADALASGRARSRWAT